MRRDLSTRTKNVCQCNTNLPYACLCDKMIIVFVEFEN